MLVIHWLECGGPRIESAADEKRFRERLGASHNRAAVWRHSRLRVASLGSRGHGYSANRAPGDLIERREAVVTKAKLLAINDGSLGVLSR